MITLGGNKLLRYAYLLCVKYSHVSFIAKAYLFFMQLR